jgi:hypothetical protein
VIRLTFVAVFVVGAISGCVAAPSPIPDLVQASASPPPSVDATPSATTVESWAPSGQPANPADFEHGDGGIAFDSPSGNIHCGYSLYREPGWWWCLLAEQTVELPAAPDGNCTGTYMDGTAIVPNGFGMDPTEPDATPTTFCAGSGDSPTLDYGMSLSYRDMGCDSTEDGMICRSLISGHGFRLSRSDYEIF